MPTHRETLVQPYTREEIFDLVVDVESYPEFVPGYRQVRARDAGNGELRVEQTLGFGPAPVRFTSIAKVHRPDSIDIDAVNGPFRRLSVRWRFDETEKGCRIDFTAAYEMDAGPFAGLFRRWFESTSHAIFESFLDRARRLYGVRT